MKIRSKVSPATRAWIRAGRPTEGATMTDHECSCAKCRGFEPWTSRFAQCIQASWIVAGEAVREGIASDVSPE